VAFAPNDERTARRLSETLGTATEIRRHRNVSGSRLSAWLPHLTMSEQETPRPLLTPGEVLQLPADEALVLVSGAPPIRARKLQYYADRNFLGRCLAAPRLSEGRYADAPPVRGDDWSGRTRTTDARLEKAWFDLVAPTTTADETPRRTREIAPRRRKEKEQRSPADLPLFAWEAPEPGAQEHDAPPGEELEKVVQFPGLRL
jgi:type IV secretion system protein VirD4